MGAGAETIGGAVLPCDGPTLLPIVKSFMGEAGMVTVILSNRDVTLGKL
jgi:hypothetical protein